MSTQRQILEGCFRNVHGRGFDSSQIEDEITMQETIYLLMNMGLGVKDYSYVWDTHGVYCRELDLDARDKLETSESKVKFSLFARKCFSSLKEIVGTGQDYPEGYMLDSIASLHYLKYVLGISDRILIKELKSRKERLSNTGLNKKALKIADAIERGTYYEFYKDISNRHRNICYQR